MARQSSKPLPRAFFVRETVLVARDLIGKILRHKTKDGVASGRIVEVEAYLGEEDPASHARTGPRGRAAIMFEEGGRAYVYLSYGMHFCMNVVAHGKGVGGAVLIRALEPLHGIDLMQERRRCDAPRLLASGPGRLTQALGIGKGENGLDLRRSNLLVLMGDALAAIDTSPRIGITRACDWPLRFHERGNSFVSQRR